MRRNAWPGWAVGLPNRWIWQRVIEIARAAEPLPAWPHGAEPETAARGPTVRIGIARDKAFGFYYAEDLAALRAAGAELLPFDTLHDARLPALDGLFIGGGFPEVFMAELQANASLRAEIAAAIDAGLPTYAECGGLMYLARSLHWQGRSCRMVGAIPGDVTVHAKPVGRGYMRLAPTADHPWPAAPGASHGAGSARVPLLQPRQPAGPSMRFAYRVERGHGIDGEHDGLVHRNLLASYAHLRGVMGNDWPARFVAFVRAHRMPQAAATRQARPVSRDGGGLLNHANERRFHPDHPAGRPAPARGRAGGRDRLRGLPALPGRLERGLRARPGAGRGTRT